MNTQLTYGGSINEGGLIRGLRRKGFNPNKCCTELIANSIDSKCININFNITREYIDIIDDGNGMVLEKLKNMFDLFRANHSESKSLGVSGIGAKAATANIVMDGLSTSSKANELYGSCRVYTHNNVDGDYLVANVNWKQIFDTKIYTNQICFLKMCPLEIEKFQGDRSSKNMKNTGTTTHFPYNEILHNTIESQFTDPDRNLLPLNDRWGYTFGHLNIQIWCNTFEKTYEPLQMYNYFGGMRPDYYTGIDFNQIDCYLNATTNENKYILHEYDPDTDSIKYKEITKSGRGYYSSQPHVAQLPKSNDWRLVGPYTVLTGMRRNLLVFDEDNIRDSVLTEQINEFCEYDQVHLPCGNNKDLIQTEISKAALYRNGQYINSIQIDGYAVNSARASAESRLKITHLRTEVHYEPVSNQSNPLDIAVGIQENKNQHDGSLPTQLNRLIQYIKDRKWMQIKTYFLKCIADKHARLKAIEETARLNAIEETARLNAIEQQKLAELEQHATYIVNAHLLCNGSGSEMVQLESNLKMIAEQSGDEESSDLDEEFEIAVQLLPVETKQPQLEFNDEDTIEICIGNKIFNDIITGNLQLEAFLILWNARNS